MKITAVLLVSALFLTSACTDETETTSRYLNEEHLRAEADTSIRPWLKHSVAPNGFFRTRFNRSWQEQDGYKFVTLTEQARILFVLATGYDLSGDIRFKEAVQSGGNFLVKNMRNPANGGWHKSVDSQGKTIRSDVEPYGYSFAIFGLSHAYRVTGDTAFLKAALDTWRLNVWRGRKAARRAAGTVADRAVTLNDGRDSIASPTASPTVSPTVSVAVLPAVTGLAPDKIAGLTLWLDASDAATLVDSDGDGFLNTWRDKSATGHIVRAPSTDQQPKLADGVTFDGSNDVLEIADAADLNLAASSVGKTLTLVFSTGKDVARRQVLYEQGGSQRGLNLYIEQSAVHLGGWNLAETRWGPSSVSGRIAANTTYVASLTFDAVAGKLSGRLNGASIGSVSGVGLLHEHSGDIGLGRMVGDSYFKDGPVRGDGLGFAGTLREVAFFGWALNSSAQTSLEAHLVNKWSAGRPPTNQGRVATRDLSERAGKGKRALTGSWSQSPFMHLFEALLILHDTTRSPEVWSDIEAMARFLETRLIQPTGCVPEWYNAVSFKPLDDAKADDAKSDNAKSNDAAKGYVEIGHQVEWAYLLSHAVEKGLNKRYLGVAERLLNFAIKHGVDASTGGLIARTGYTGIVHNDSKWWWAQAELMRAAAHFAVRRGRGDLWPVYQAAHDFVLMHHVDQEFGGWAGESLMNPVKKSEKRTKVIGYYAAAFYNEALSLLRPASPMSGK
jgi:mannose/cellobiose epimerase-like protein (N-acyl-D-glucosamine 2-epimerase family)